MGHPQRPRNIQTLEPQNSRISTSISKYKRRTSQTQRKHHVYRTDLHCYQACWRPAWTHWPYHLSIRGSRIQACRYQVDDCQPRAPREALRGSLLQAILPRYHPRDYAIDVGRNVCHGSDSVENAKKEIALWFKEGEVQSWKSAQHDWVYEK